MGFAHQAGHAAARQGDAVGVVLLITLIDTSPPVVMPLGSLTPYTLNLHP